MKITASSQVIVNGGATVMERRGSRQKQSKGSCEYRVESGKVWLNYLTWLKHPLSGASTRGWHEPVPGSLRISPRPYRKKAEDKISHFKDRRFYIVNVPSTTFELFGRILKPLEQIACHRVGLIAATSWPMTIPTLNRATDDIMKCPLLAYRSRYQDLLQLLNVVHSAPWLPGCAGLKPACHECR